MPAFPRLQQLPKEILLHILTRLHQPDLESFNLVSKWCYDIATPLIWQDVELVDCSTDHDDIGLDEHDDTHLIRKLLLLASKPHIAASVQVLTHRCHLPPPSLFNELPRMTFSARTLSADARTIRLVQLAVKNMTHVHTLRIIFGHPNLTHALLRCFFDVGRLREYPEYKRIRKLWLENCRISAGLDSSDWDQPYDLPQDLVFSGLESIRFRRLPMETKGAHEGDLHSNSYNYSRGGVLRELQNGIGGRYRTTCNAFLDEIGIQGDVLDLYEKAHSYEDRTYEGFMSVGVQLPACVQELASMSPSQRGEQALGASMIIYDEQVYPDFHYEWGTIFRERIPAADAAIALLRNASDTLTSINFDWVLSVPSVKDFNAMAGWAEMFSSVFALRFPHLRAFQFRNCVVPDTVLPAGLFLFDHSDLGGIGEGADQIQRGRKHTCLGGKGLEFMEAHPNLQCLAWPMDHFFGAGKVSAGMAQRVDAVIENLGRTLTDLRVDCLYSSSGEPQSEEHDCPDPNKRIRRRRFITHFAAHLTHIRTIKLEGGIPRDERRETIRALHRSPLQKIVLIGVCSPLGNTWGANGTDLPNDLSPHDLSNLEPESLPPTSQLPPPATHPFDPTYTCLNLPPLLAALPAETIRTLKFCGYKGASPLFSPPEICTQLFAPLKHFHHLESLILSFWLTTTRPAPHDSEPFDDALIAFWLDARDSSSTALAILPEDEDPDSLSAHLRTNFSPSALAQRVAEFLTPFLSETALGRGDGLGRKQGIHIRASFCVGDWGGIFDLDLWIGAGGQVLKFEGPREEGEGGRRGGKMGGRGWF